MFVWSKTWEFSRFIRISKWYRKKIHFTPCAVFYFYKTSKHWVRRNARDGDVRSYVDWNKAYHIRTSTDLLTLVNLTWNTKKSQSRFGNSKTNTPGPIMVKPVWLELPCKSGKSSFVARNRYRTCPQSICRTCRSTMKPTSTTRGVSKENSLQCQSTLNISRVSWAHTFIRRMVKSPGTVV